MSQHFAFTPPKGTVPVRISPETTFITKPLTASGNVDYVAAMEQHFAPKCPPEENGFRDLVRALGKPAFHNESLPDSRWEYLCRKLDLDPDLVPVMRYEPIPDAKTGLSSWTGNGFQQWIAGNESLYRLFETAIDRPFFYAIYAPGNDETPLISLLPDISFSRDVARRFNLRSCYRLGLGDIESAWQDVLSIFRLAGHLRRQPFLLGQLFGFAIEGVAASQVVAVLKQGRFDVPMLRKFLDDIASLPESATYDDVVLSERFYCLETLCWISRHGYDSSGSQDEMTSIMPEFIEEQRAVEEIVRKVPFDWNVILRIANEMFDRILLVRSMKSTGIEIFGVPDGPLRLKVREYLKTDLRARSESFGRRLMDHCGSNIGVFLPVSVRNQTSMELTRLAVLLEIRRLEKGDYPNRIDVLREEGYLPAPPIDRMNRAVPALYPYRREGSGYLLYSVGMSGRDDGGRSEGFLDDGTTWCDDVVVKMER